MLGARLAFAVMLVFPITIPCRGQDGAPTLAERLYELGAVDVKSEFIQGKEVVVYLDFGCPDFKEKLEDILKLIPTVRHLNLNGATLDDKDIARICEIKTIRTLEIGYTGATTKSLASISTLPDLIELRLDATKIFPEDLNALKNSMRLKLLHMRTTNLDDRGLEAISALPLDHLTLTGTKITDDGLFSLRANKALKFLGIGYCDVTDKGVEHLRRLEGLVMLDVCSTRVSDACIESLAKLKAMKLLRVGGTEVTKAGIEKLKETLPRVEVDFSNALSPSAHWKF